MLFFLLIAACVAEDVTLGFGAEVNGSITVKIDPSVMLDKCIASKYLNMKIVKEGEKYYAGLYKDAECKTALNKLDKIELTIFQKAVELPVFQEGITINLGGNANGAVTIAYPFGCLLSMIPGIDAALNGNADLAIDNLAFVHTQFGVSVHSYTEGKCEGTDSIKEIFTKASEQVKNAVNNIKINIGDVVNMMKDEKFAAGLIETVDSVVKRSLNKFEVMKEEMYNYAQQLPTILNDVIYEFNGTVMKVYEKVGDKLVYIQDALKQNSDRIINVLKQGTKEILITGDCDGGIQFGWNGETFQELQVGADGKCNIAINDNSFNLNMKAKVIANSEGLKIKINGQDYEFDLTKVKNDLKEMKSAIVESFGSYSEFEMNVCKEIDLVDIFDSFKEYIISSLGQYSGLLGGVIDYLNKVEAMTEEALKPVQEMLKLIPGGEDLLKFSYMIKPLEINIGEQTKYFATFNFFLSKDCSGNNLFDLITGVINEEMSKKVLDTGYSLIKYLDQEKCGANEGKDGFAKDHVDIDVCINGKMYVVENEVLSFKECTGDKKKAQLKEEVKTFPCGTCVKCLKEQGVIGSDDTVYVECGARGIFTLLLVFLFFVLF